MAKLVINTYLGTLAQVDRRKNRHSSIKEQTSWLCFEGDVVFMCFTFLIQNWF